MKTVILILISLIAISAGLGCAALSEYITPARIEPKAIVYAADAGIADPESFDGYQNLEKAIRLEAAVNAAHQAIQFSYAQLMEKDNLDYALLNDLVMNNLSIARAREESLFGEAGLLSIGLSMAGAGGLAGLIGLMRKRPGDITKEEMESALTDIHGELSEKDRQFLEIIKGVQHFIDINDTGTKQVDGASAVSALKVSLSAAQSANTKTAIATIKAKENL